MDRSLATGSIEDVVHRLVVWTINGGKGIALVRYDSEPARGAAIDRFVGELELRGHTSQVIDLTAFPTSDQVNELADSLIQAPAQSVILVHGIAGVTTNEEDARERLGQWNFARERLTSSNVAQIWWLSRPVADALARVSPDLFSWILLRLDLTDPTSDVLPILDMIEAQFSAGHGEMLVYSKDSGLVRATAQRLEERFFNLPSEDRKGRAGLEAAIRISSSLLKAGLNSEAVGVLSRLAQCSGYSSVDDWGQAVETDPLRHAALLAVLIDLAMAFGDLPLAEARCSLRIQRLSEIQPPDGEGVLSAKYLFAIISRKLGKIEDSLSLLEEVLSQEEKVRGRDRFEFAQVLHAYGNTLGSLGRFAEAYVVLQEALETHTKYLGEVNAITAGDLQSMATFLATEGKHSEARELYRRSLDIYRQTVGENAPQAIMCMSGMGGTFNDSGLLEDAREWYERALSAARRVWGDHHYEAAVTMNNLARLLYEEGKYETAYSLDSNVLEIRRHQLGECHKETLNALGHLAMESGHLGDWETASRIASDAYNAANESLGSSHPETLWLGKMLIVSLVMRDGTAPIPFIEDIASRQKNSIGVGDPRYLDTVVALISQLAVQGDFKRAKDVLLDTLPVAEEVLGKDSDTVAMLKNIDSLVRDQESNLVDSIGHLTS